MKLKSFGCSFIYGSDLGDCPHGVDADNPPPSKLTWPALLANHYGLEYQCHARPAAGNLQILETLLSSIEPDENNLYVVNWTWIERFSFVSDATKSGQHPWNPLGWCNILPSDQGQVAQIYYQHLHSQFRDKLETLLCINSAIDMLRHNHADFLMTYTDDLIFETKWHTSSAVLNLQKCVRPYVMDWNGQSFWMWANNNGFPISEAWHPLEEAHAAAAKLMMPAIDAILHKV